jgi:hypothetical protein
MTRIDLVKESQNRGAGVPIPWGFFKIIIRLLTPRELQTILIAIRQTFHHPEIVHNLILK